MEAVSVVQGNTLFNPVYKLLTFGGYKNVTYTDLISQWNTLNQ